MSPRARQIDADAPDRNPDCARTLVARLQRLAGAVKSLGDDGEWLAAVLHDVLGGMPFKEAAGLKVAPGKRSPLAREFREARDNALRATERFIFLGRPDIPIGDRTAELRKAIRLYDAVWFRNDRNRLGVMPANYADKISEHLFAAYLAHQKFKAMTKAASDKFPDSESFLRRILSLNA